MEQKKKNMWLISLKRIIILWVGQYYNAYTPHLLYVCASFFFEHLFLMTRQLASLGKGYRDFPLHMGTENIFHTTGTTGNRAVHTLAFTVTLISTLDLISQRCRMLLTEFKTTRQASFTASATNATETQCLIWDFSSFLGLVLWHQPSSTEWLQGQQHFSCW